MHVILSYFDQLAGPRFHLTSHPHLAIHIENIVLDLLDIDIQKGFFEYNYYSEDYDVLLANYYVEIESEWARGKSEQILLTIVADPIQNPKAFKPLLEKYAKILKETPNLYKAIYSGSKEDSEIKIMQNELKKIFQNLVKDCENSLEETTLGQIAVIGPSAVGKTSILNAINQKAFDPSLKPTLGIQITRVVLESYKINAYDVGGQARFGMLYQRLLHPPKGIIFIIDINASKEKQLQARELFRNILEHYYGEKCRACTDEKIPVLILGNKIDLNPDFDKDCIKKWLELEEFDIEYKIYTTSALKNIRVYSSFRWLVQKLVDINE
jgi:small GTP-binding protein